MASKIKHLSIHICILTLGLACSPSSAAEQNNPVQDYDIVEDDRDFTVSTGSEKHYPPASLTSETVETFACDGHTLTARMSRNIQYGKDEDFIVHDVEIAINGTEIDLPIETPAGTHDLSTDYLCSDSTILMDIVAPNLSTETVVAVASLRYDMKTGTVETD